MRARKSVLTTGEVARICNVAPRTVSKWFDSGQLNGYRIPGSKDRRIPVDQLLRFMRTHGIPLDGLQSGRLRVLVLDADRSLCATLETSLSGVGDIEVSTATTALEAGSAAQQHSPDVLLVDVTLPDARPAAVVRWARSQPGLASMRLIGTATNLSDGRGQELLQQGFDDYLAKPFDSRTLLERIERVCGQHAPV